MSGAELHDPSQGMAGRLFYKLTNGSRCYTFSNLAKDGASNDNIYDTTVKYLEDPANPIPDLVVIGWSQFNRIQWFLVDKWNKGQFWEINNIGVGIPIPDAYQERYQHWSKHVERDGHWHLVQSSYWHNKIFNLHALLDFKRIPHLFFNAFDHFVLHEKHYHQDWNHRFLSPYDDSLIYTKWCARQGYEEITPGWQHYDEHAHDQWADIMFNHIKEHKII